MIKFHSPVLITRNLDVQKRFYTIVLQQEIELDLGACIILKCGISLWQLSENHTIAKQNGSSFSANGNKNLELCFETDQFDLVISKIKEHNLSMLHDVLEEDWGQRTIRFYDPEQNLIELGETIPCFVRRMFDSGMSLDKIAQRTSVPMDLIKKYTTAN